MNSVSMKKFLVDLVLTARMRNMFGNLMNLSISGKKCRAGAGAR